MALFFGSENKQHDPVLLEVWGRQLHQIRVGKGSSPLQALVIVGKSEELARPRRPCYYPRVCTHIYQDVHREAAKSFHYKIFELWL